MRVVSSESRALTVARWCVYLVAGLVPIAASYYPGFSDSALPLTYDQYALVKFALAILLAGVGLAAWLVHATATGARVRRVRHLEYAVGALLAWSLMSTLFSVHRPTAVFGTYGRFEGLIALVSYAMIAFVALQVLDSQQRLRELAVTFVVSGSIISAYGLLQSFGVLAAPEGTLLFETERAFSTYGNPDMLGLFLLIPVALSLGLVLSESELRLRATYWVAFALSAAALLLTFTRAAWLAFALAIVVTGFAAWRLRVRFTRVDVALSALVVLGLLGLGVRSVASGSAVTNVAQRFLSLFDAGSGSVASRLDIWSGTLALVAVRPLAGFGLDTVFLVWGSHASPGAAAVLAKGQVDSAHSLPLQLAAGMGVIGAVLYFVALVWALVLGVRMVLDRRETRGMFLLAAYCVALVSLLLASVVSVTDAGLGVLIWLLAAAIAAPSAQSSASPVRLPMSAAVAVAVTLTVTVAGLSGMLIGADHAMARARIEAGTQQGIEWSARAVARNPWNEEYRLELGLQHQDRFLDLSARGQTPLALDQFGRAEEVLLVLNEKNPWYLEGHLALADLYLWATRFIDSGYAEEAMKAAERARERSPGSPGTIGVTALALAAQGRTVEAEAALSEGLRVMPGNEYLEGLLELVSGTDGSE